MRDNELGHTSGSPRQLLKTKRQPGGARRFNNFGGGAVDHLVGLALVLLEACLSKAPDDLVGKTHLKSLALQAKCGGGGGGGWAASAGQSPSPCAFTVTCWSPFPRKKKTRETTGDRDEASQRSKKEDFAPPLVRPGPQSAPSAGPSRLSLT